MRNPSSSATNHLSLPDYSELPKVWELSMIQVLHNIVDDDHSLTREKIDTFVSRAMSAQARGDRRNR
jgi:hypothetical protein